MTVGRQTSRHSANPAYRGTHGTDARQRRPASERTRIAFFLTALVALALLFVAALVPLRRDRSRLLPPIPAGVSQPPLVPVPAGSPSTSPSASPSTSPSPSSSVVVTDPPGFPTSMPTAGPVTPSPSSPPPILRTTSFEAESAVNTLTGDAHVRAVADASGGEVITGIGGGEGNALRFNQILVPADGVYTLAIFYTSAASRSLTVRVDGSPEVSIRFAATGDSEIVGSLTLRVRLESGANTIEFGNPLDRGPDIDEITVGS